MKLQYCLIVNLRLDIRGERNATVADKELIKKKKCVFQARAYKCLCRSLINYIISLFDQSAKMVNHLRSVIHPQLDS